MECPRSILKTTSTDKHICSSFLIPEVLWSSVLNAFSKSIKTKRSPRLTATWSLWTGYWFSEIQISHASACRTGPLIQKCSWLLYKRIILIMHNFYLQIVAYICTSMYFPLLPKKFNYFNCFSILEIFEKIFGNSVFYNFFKHFLVKGIFMGILLIIFFSNLV